MSAPHLVYEANFALAASIIPICMKTEAEMNLNEEM